MASARFALVEMLVKTEPGFPHTPIAKIPLQNGMFAFCDPKWLYAFSFVHWYAKKSRGVWYVCTKVSFEGKIRFRRMHRIVAHTPDGYVPHHLNGNSLDNREKNLLNITDFVHRKYFSYW